MDVPLVEYDWFDALNNIVYRVEYFYDCNDGEIKHLIHLDPDNPIRDLHVDPTCFLPTYRRSTPPPKLDKK